MQEMWVWSLDQKDPLEKEIANHSSIRAWKSHGQRSLVGYSPSGHKRVGHDWATSFHFNQISVFQWVCVLKLWLTSVSAEV